LSSNLLQELMTGDKLGGRSFMHTTIFEDLDFNFEERLKNLDIVERAAGVRNFLKGKEMAGQWKFSTAEEHLLRAHSTLETAIEANPSDIFLCMLVAELCSEIHEVMKVQSDGKLIAMLNEKAEKSEVLLMGDRVKVVLFLFCLVFIQYLLLHQNHKTGREAISGAC
jgi:hypothetical protein